MKWRKLSLFIELSDRKCVTKMASPHLLYQHKDRANQQRHEYTHVPIGDENQVKIVKNIENQPSVKNQGWVPMG